MFGNHLHLFLFINFVNLFYYTLGEIPKTVLCADPSCTVPISEAQGKLTYSPIESNVLGFKKGIKMYILSKSKEKDGYWGAKIGNKIGYVPSNYVKELTVWKSTDMLTYEVPSRTYNENISSQAKENAQLGNDNLIVNTVSETEHSINDASRKGAARIPLSDLIHGDIHDMSGETSEKDVQSHGVNLEAENLRAAQISSNDPANNIKIGTDNEVPSTIIQGEFEQPDNNKLKVNENLAGQTNTNDGGNGMEESDVLKSENLESNELQAENSNTVNPESVILEPHKSVNDKINNNQDKMNLSDEETDASEIALDMQQNEDTNLNDTTSEENLKENVANHDSTVNSNKNEGINDNSWQFEKILKTDSNNNSSISISSSSSSSSSTGDSDNKGDLFWNQFGNADSMENKDISNNMIVNISHETYTSNAQEIAQINDTTGGVLAATNREQTPKPTEGEKETGDVTQNILHSHNIYNDGNNDFQSTPGTILNKVNVQSDALGMNINGNVGSDSTVESGVNDNTSSDDVSSNGSGSASPSDAQTESDDNYVKDMGTASKKPSVTTGNLQEGIKVVPNIVQSMTASGGQFAYPYKREILENRFDSGSKPAPVNVNIPPGQAAYDNLGQQENVNAGVPSQNFKEIEDEGSLPNPVNTNSNQYMYEKYASSVTETVHHHNTGVPGSSESSTVNHNNKQSMAAQLEDSNKVLPSSESNEPVARPPESVDNLNKGDNSAGDMEKLQPEEKLAPDSYFANPTESSADIERKPSEIPVKSVPESSNFEFSTQGTIDRLVETASNAEESPAGDNEKTSTLTSDPVPSDTGNAVEGNDFKENSDDDGFFSKMLSWVGFGSKKIEQDTEINQGNNLDVMFTEQTSLGLNSQENMASLEDGSCKSEDGSPENCEETPTSDVFSIPWNFWMDSNTATVASSYNTFIYLVVTAVTVLLFTLGYYFIEKFRSDGSLIAKVNKLEQELLVSSKECLILKDELTNTKEKLNLFETSSNDKIIAALQLELEESKKTRSELENNIIVLQQELDTATEAGLDLNRMLSEVLTQKGGSETLMESVEHLQGQLNNQQKIIDEMTSKLIAKTKENQELQDELALASEKMESLEGEIEDMRGNLNVHLKDNEDVIKELTSKNNELLIKVNQLNESREKEVAKMKKSTGELEKKLKAVTDSLKIKEEECNNLKDSVKKIKVKDSKSVDSLFDTSRIKAELTHASSENNSLKERLKAEEQKYLKLEIKLQKMEEDLLKLKQINGEAEKEKTEAQTRLEVLSNYFKEKETQLQKELGLREAMWVQKQGDDSTIYERMKSLEEEITSCKSQNEALKKEILDQERGLKAQITTLEKKAHENWIAARQAERKLEESKQEAGQLRNKLTLMEKNISNDLDSSQHHRVNEELNGGDAMSPLMHDASSPILFPPPLPLDPNNSSLMPPGFIPPPMFMPPPPGGFMPPPPPFLPGDHRPPPLGRMSSPPLNNRFSPPPPDYAYDGMSTPPLFPSNRNYKSPNEADRDRERFRHRTPTSPSFRSRNWEEGPSVGISGFRPISSERDSRRERKGGSNLSSGHSSDSLDKASRHSGRV